MHVLIAEPHAAGHHASYLRWLVQTAVARQWSVTIATTSEASTHASLSTIAVDFAGVHVEVFDDFPGMGSGAIRPWQLLHREFAYWKGFKRALKEVRRKASIDAVILPYVDYCLYALAIRGSPFEDLPWCGIAMRLGVGQREITLKSTAPLKWRVAKRVLGSPTLRTLFVINPSVQDAPANWLSDVSFRKLRYLADPTDYQPSAARRQSRADLGISDGDVAVLVFGTIDERKGIDSLLNSLESQNGLDNYVVILAGRQSAGVQNLLRTSRYTERLNRRLIVIDRFLPEAEQDLVFAAADVVWVGYRNHVYMSGVLVLAGRAGLPVVGSPGGEIGRLITKHSLGVVVRIDRPAEVGAALRSMLSYDTRSRFGQTAQAIFADHTVDKFGASVMAVFQC
jgi:glycosyltransferase involved in cell wall biosynthesis